MYSKYQGIIVACVVLASASIGFAGDEKKATDKKVEVLSTTEEQSCRYWAKEDGVPQEDMENYMQVCMEQMKAADSDDEVTMYEDLSGSGEEIVPYEGDYDQELQESPPIDNKQPAPKKKP